MVLHQVVYAHIIEYWELSRQATWQMRLVLDLFLTTTSQLME